MAKKWSEVASDPKFKSATPEQQKAIADGFFNDVIKPEVPSNQNIDAVRGDFLAKALPKQPSVVERISAGLSDLVEPRSVVNANAKQNPSTFKQYPNSIDRLLPSVATDRVKDAQFRSNAQLVQQGYDPRGAAEVTLQNDSARIERLNQEAVKPVDMRYARPMTEKPERSLLDYYKDTAGAVAKIPGAVVRDVANIGNMLTGDTMPTDVAGTMQRGMDEFDRRFGSAAKNYENQEFASIANDKNQGFGDQVNFLLQNPAALADKGITTIGSMFIPAGVSAGALGVASKLFGGNIPAKLETILKSGTIAGTVAMQNAAETFNDEELKSLPLEKRYEAAGITALGTLLGNKIFGGGIERAIADKFNKSGAAQGLALAGKEGGQEALESLSGSAGKAAVAPGSVSVNQAIGGALTEGMLGGVMGGGVAAIGMTGNREQLSPTNTGAVDQTVEMPVSDTNVQASKGQQIIEHLKKLKGISNAQQSPATEAVNISDLIGDENVSNTTQRPNAGVDRAATGNELDNGIGSPAIEPALPNENAGSNSTVPNGSLPASDIPDGVASAKPVADITPQKPRKAKPKANTLLSVIDGLGGIDNKYKWDISGEQRFARGGYNKIFRKASTKTLEQHIENGDLDDFLPYEMRSTVSNDPTDGRNYLADRIRNGDRVLPYDVELEAKQSKLYETDPLQTDIENAIMDDAFDLDTVNALLSEAGYDEREQQTENRYIETQPSDASSAGQVEETQSTSTAVDIAGDTRREDGQQAAALPDEVTQSARANAESQERDGVRPFVEAIVKRRAAASQIGKSKEFDSYLLAAKDFLSGKEVKPTRFKLAATAFQNDKPLSDAFAKLAELAKIPAKQARQAIRNEVDELTSAITAANTVEQLDVLATRINAGSLSDAQVQQLDDLVMARMDEIAPSESEATQEANPEPVEPPPLELETETNEEILAREQEIRETAEALRREEARAIAEREREDARRRIESQAGNVDNFVMGESSREAAKPQRDMFGGTNKTVTMPEQGAAKSERPQPGQEGYTLQMAREDLGDLLDMQRRNGIVGDARLDERITRMKQLVQKLSKDEETPAPETDETSKAKADLNSALSDLGDIFGKSFSANITPEQEQKLIPVLTRLFDAAFRLGYQEFKQAAKFVLDTIRTNIGNDVADAVNIDQLQGSYIAMAGKYGDKATKKSDVISVESKSDIEAVQSQNGYVKNSQSENSEATDNAKPTQAGPIPRTDTQNDLFTEQSRDSNSESVAAGVAGTSQSANPTEPVRGSVQEASGNRTPSAGRSDRNESPSGSREVSNAGNQPSTADDGVSDFAITDDTGIGEGSLAQKYNDNITAIKLIKTLEAEGRQATPEERNQLAKYNGFGALSKVFEPGNVKYKELKELLTDEEYNAARASILNAYFTSPAIVKSMYDAVSQLGFKGGRVLEPSLGSGNFFGMMPAGMRNKSQLNGVELDIITSRLAKFIYPNANIAVATGFQQYDAPQGYFDLVISNPPFGSETLVDAKKADYSGFSIHNFFIAKSIDKLRENGIMAVVVSHSFMDAMDSRARQWISKRANLLGGVRLPNTAFKDNAGTEVITDILFFQKTSKPQSSPEWLDVTDNGDYTFNNYFIANPRNVLGRVEDTTSQFGKTFTVEPLAGNGTLAQQLKEFVSRLPQNVYVEPESRIEVLDSADNTVPDSVKVGTYYIDASGAVRQRMPDTLGSKRSVAWESPNAKAQARMVAMMNLRDLLRRQMRLERDPMASEKDIEGNRTKLNREYDKFLAEYGYLNSTTNRRLFMDDTESALLQALEIDYDQGVTAAKSLATGIEQKPASAQKADIFNRRVLFPPSDSIIVNNAKDALLSSLDVKGRVDVDYMAEVYKKPVAEIVSELGDVIYNDPVKGYVTADEYLSGDVKTKLAEAEAKAGTDSAFARNVEALKKVIPTDKLPSEIYAAPGANWIPADVYSEFTEVITGIAKNRSEYKYVSATAVWLGEKTSNGDAGKMVSDFGTEDVNAFDLFNMLINGKAPEVKETQWVNGERKSVINIEKTEAARSKLEKIKESWHSWIFSDAERADRLATIYNEKHNRIVKRVFDGSHMQFYGMSPAVTLRPSQKNVVWRAIQDRNVLLDHVVGAGKTMAMASIAMEMKRLGIARKPLFVVPNHLTLQWRSEFTKLYPASNILAATPEDFTKEKRERMFAKMVTGTYDAIIIGHSSLKKVGLPADVESKMYEEQIKELTDAIEAAKKDRGDRGITRDMEKIKQNLQSKIDKLKLKAGEKDNVVSFDELGVDAMFVDEMHEFKNLFFTTQMQRTAGLGNPAGSGKALDMFMKVRYMTQRFGENVPLITATGTPVSNSLAEMFTMQRYMKYPEMKRQGLHLFDAWAKQYGEVENVYEVAPSGVGYRQSTRFSKFKNLPSLLGNYTQFADIVTMQDLKDQATQQGKIFPVPQIKSGKPINVIAQRSELQRDFFGVPQLKTNEETGEIEFELNPAEAGIGRMDNGKYRLSFTNGFEDFDTFEEAELELVTKSLTPRTYIDPKSLLGQFANLQQLTRETKGKINALSLTGLANKAGLDYRIINPSAPDYANSKINLAVNNMVQLWKDTTKDKGTQIVFCDMSVPLSARANAASKERYALVRGRNGELIHKKATLHTVSDMEGFPFYLVESGSRDSKSIAIYEPVSGVLINDGFSDKKSAKDFMQDLLSTDNGRNKIFGMRDTNEGITKDDIDEYFAEQEKIEIADDNSNLITPEDLEAIAGSSSFSVYDDIKEKLIKNGVPDNQIAFIHDFNTPKQKEDLFKRVKRGEVRFLFGSTPKLGAGTNVQDRLVGLHHIDAPWRPSDLEQREGRIIRQGNKLAFRPDGMPIEGFEVAIYRYATEQTYDTRRWQLLEHKAAGIEQLRKYTGEAEIEDVATEASNSADMKAAASGNPLILEETKLRTEVKRLQNLEKAHADSKFSMGRKIKQNENAINQYLPEKIKGYEGLMADAKANPVPNDKDKVAPINVDGQKTTSKEIAEKALLEASNKVRNSLNTGESKSITYRGIKFTISRGFFLGQLRLDSPDGMMHAYGEKEGFSPSGVITRFNNYIDSFDAKIKQAEAAIAFAENENNQLRPRLNEPFEDAALLKQTQARHADVQRKLMKSSQLEAVPEAQRPEFDRVIAERKAQLKQLGYEKALQESEADDSLELNQNLEQYKPYDTDIFGNEIPTNTATRANRNADSTAAIQDGAEYYARTFVGTEQKRQLGAAVIRNAAQAAQATQYLYKSAVERMDAIVTDDKGTPLAIIGGFKGSITQTQIYMSTLVSEAISVNGGTKLWLSHNHPSGKSVLSSADVRLHNRVKEVLDGSGIELQGLIAVAGGEYGYIGVDGESSNVQIDKPSAYGRKVPVIERELVDDRTDDVAITGPASARIIASKFYEKANKPGMMLLDAQNRVSAWVPINDVMLGKLRNTGGLNAIYKAVAKGNPNAAILVHGGELGKIFSTPVGGVNAGINIASALKAIEVKTLDVVNVNQARTASERGDVIDSNIFFSRDASFKRDPMTEAIAGLRRQQTEAVGKVQSHVNTITQGWANAPLVTVVYDMNDERIPEAVRRENERQLSQGASGQPEGFIVGGKVYIVASEMRGLDDVTRVLFHESLGHYGLRGLFGDALKPTLNKIVIGRKSEVQAKAKQYGLDFNNERDRLIAAEEVLAELAQSKPEIGLVQRAIAAIRTWLRENVPYFKNMALTDDEIIRNYLLPARQFVERGGNPVTIGSRAVAMSRELPDTITVNGISRPTLNSNGKPIHPTREGIENFWKWFGNSRVVDEQGRPLVVYHGTDKDFDSFDKDKKGSNTGWANTVHGFFFIGDKKLAQNFSQENNTGGNVRVLDNYLSLKNPIDLRVNAVFNNAKQAPVIIDFITNGEEKLSGTEALEWINEEIGLGEWAELLDTLNTEEFTSHLKNNGFDGVIANFGDNNAEYVAFEPNQIKSATGNNGNFDSGNDSILFSRQSPINQEWESLEDSGRLKNLQYAFQDKYVDLKDVIKAVKQTGREVVDSLNAYLQEELYHGRVAKRVQDFTKKELEPLLNSMRVMDVSMPELEMYLWARHAPERNAQIAKINPDNDGLQDGGSGMTTAEAESYMASIDPANRAKLDKLAGMIDAINKQSRNILMAYGIEDMDTMAKMEQTYEYYVPLMRDIGGNVEGGFGTGQGFSVKGNSTKRAMGSTKPVVDIIANIAAQREKFIVRGEKNRVATALVGLAITNPKGGFWSVDNPPKLRYVDKATGFVEETIDPNYKTRSNVVVARFLNKQGRVVERAVVFNEKDQRALRLAESIKNLDVDGMEDWLRNIGGITRYFSSVNTQYNPIFGVVNIVRDVQGAMINLESTAIAGKQKEVMASVFPAMAGVWRSLRAERNGQEISGQWQQLWEEYQSEGGQTGYREMFASASERTKKLNRTVDPDWWTKTKLGKLITFQNAHVAKAEKFFAEQANKWIFENLSDYNQTLENAVRLAAYKTALDAGLSKQQAASLGKNLTVNFNRKGAASARMGALYAFFNASAQGTARIAETIYKDGKLTRTGKVVIQGGVLLGIAQALALAAAGFGDDDPPEFERDRNLILPIGNGKYIKLAMPLGYHIIPSTTRKVTEFLMGKNQTPAELIASLGALYADGLNPLGGGSLAQVITPTALDPAMALYANEDGLGRRIYQEKFSQSDTTAGYLMARDTANALSKSVAYAINLATGGSDYTEGVLSPTPDQISFLAEQVGGGVAREIIKAGDVASSVTTGTALPTYRIPLIGRFYGDAKSKTSHAHEFYANIERMDRHKREIQGRIRDGLDTADYVRKHPDAVLWKQAQLTARTVSKLRQRRENLLSQGRPKQDVESVEALIAQKEERFNQLVKDTGKRP